MAPTQRATLVTMLRATPANTEVLLVRIVKTKRVDEEDWKKDALILGRLADREMRYVAEPLPRSAPVETAHNTGRSVWTLPRRDCTLEFLNGIETIAHAAWTRLPSKRPWPPMPAPASVDVYVPGWTDAE